MNIALASDHAGYALKERLKVLLDELGHVCVDFGTRSEESCDYPDFAFPASEALARGEVDRAVLVCGSGVGMSMCANRVAGVRAALCSSVEIARLSRRHNDANALCLAARFIDGKTAFEVVRVWLDEAFEGGRHARRVSKMAAYDRSRSR